MLSIVFFKSKLMMVLAIFFTCCPFFPSSGKTAQRPVAPCSQSISTFFEYKLGETVVKLEYYENNCGNGLVYFHPHENEKASEIVRRIIDTHGGKAYFLQHGGGRLVRFMLYGKSYQFDPNRIFSPEGVEASLRWYGLYSAEAARAVYQFAMWISGMMSTPRIVAVHNNRDQGYNILSYMKEGRPIPGIESVYINKENDPGNFIYTTHPGLFSAAKVNKINAVLQGTSLPNDGSYSVFAQKHGIDYTNIEAVMGDKKDDRDLISFVNRYYSIPQVTNQTWSLLKAGDTIDLVATSSAYNPAHIKLIQKAFAAYGLKARAIYAKQSDASGLGYAGTDEMRARQLISALKAPDSKAVWAIRGGAGVSNILPMLLGSPPLKTPKLLIGFSDVTGVHLFLNSKWGWPTIHGVVAAFNAEVDRQDNEEINQAESIKPVIDMITGKVKERQYTIEPLNEKAKKSQTLSAPLIGGNLTLVSTSLGTPYQPPATSYILVLEDIGNSVHQLERFLDQIAHSTLLSQTKAVILGEFLHQESGDSPAVRKLTNLVLQRFSNKVEMPVFRFNRFGHGRVNNPLPLNTATQITKMGDKHIMTIQVR